MEVKNGEKYLENAKMLLLDYLKDGKEKAPSDFDRDILKIDPIESIINLMFFKSPKWNSSVFCEALNILIQEKKVSYRFDLNVGYLYKLRG